MQTDDAAGSTDTVAENAVGASRRFRLPPRTLLLVVAGLLLLAVIAAGSWAYLAKSQRPEKVAATQGKAAEAKATRDKATQARAAAEWEAQVRAAENVVQLEAARRAHAAIMAADTPSVVGAAAGLSAVATSVVAPAPAAPAGAAAPSGTAAPAAKSETVAAEPAAPAGETPALGPDGCTLSGSSPQEFGTALGRCLEEFNRMEEGVGEAAAPARRSRR